MKYITAFFFSVFCIAIASTAYAQSLAEIADKEKQRREQTGEAPKTITNDSLSNYSGGSVSTITPLSLPSKKSDSENIEEDVESENQGVEVDPDEPVDFMGRPESYWRETMTSARKKVKDLEDETTVLTLRLNKLQTEFYNSGDGFRQQSVQREIQKTYYEQDLNKENLAKAKEELADLEKEARKSGALPGWIR